MGTFEAGSERFGRQSGQYAVIKGGPEIPQIAGVQNAVIGDPGDVGEAFCRLRQRWHQGSVEAVRNAVPRRLAACADPFVEIKEECAQYRVGPEWRTCQTTRSRRSSRLSPRRQRRRSTTRCSRPLRQPASMITASTATPALI